MKKDERLLRIGVLGCGPIAQIAHFDACRKARNAELYAICDVADDLRARMADIHQPAVSYNSFDAMLADPRVEAVIIAAADQYHVPLSLRAVTAGKHVLVEKPMGVAVEECAELAKAVQAAGVVLQVGHNRRFDPGVTFAQRFIREEMGGMMALKAWYCDSTDRYTMTDNLHPLTYTSSKVQRPAGRPKTDKQRYFMLAHGSHLVDMARFLGGNIVSVQAQLVARFATYCWFVSVEFADGSVGHLDLTIPVRGDFEEGFRIYGEYGSVHGRLHLPWFHKAGDVECFSVKDGLYRRPLGEDAHSYKRQIEGFAETILTGVPQQGADATDGLAAIQAMVAIARSVAMRERVRLDTVAGGL